MLRANGITKHETDHHHHHQSQQAEESSPLRDSNNNHQNSNSNSNISSMVTNWWKEWSDVQYDGIFVLGVCLVDTVLCALIVRYVAYTEIDWIAYMQEVEGWLLHGEYDYRQLRGDTGPLVYPAGFLYLFALLRHVTDQGTNVWKAQCIFLGIYILQLFVVLLIYTKVMRCRLSTLLSLRSSASGVTSLTTPTTAATTKDSNAYASSICWSWRIAMGLLCLSKRIHSIFVLRLFNDGIAMLLCYISLYLFMNQSWKWGCAWFSFAVSIKMNVLLFAPGLLLLLLQANDTLFGTLQCLSICASIQLILGAPFLMTYPESYLRKAFELDRTFFYKWTVNWKFLSEESFLSKPLALFLLALHLGTLFYFAILWIDSTARATAPCNNNDTQQGKGNSKDKGKYNHHAKSICLGKPLQADYIVYTMLVSNFVGIVFARTLHYQFYSWYFHAIPLLLWISYTPTVSTSSSTSWSLSSSYIPLMTILIRIGIWSMIEYAFNIFPATPWSSAILQLAHLVILLCYIKSPHELRMKIIVDDDDNDNDNKMSQTTTTTTTNVKME